ncbi:hypothetical protein [Pseudactinotalea suaedae]|uniref:hypothetical protein n=1 Tax=Pseudactinotalea suaedae TaxID=1524924 RepID=UPI0012E1BB5E|nr:hypothetical protein [Pseudactinotalea suaedae]
MTATITTTALPYDLGEDAAFHLSAFVTHKLEPDADATLGDFPAVETWVKTLARGSWLVSASTLAEPVPATPVSEPDQAVWSALLPPTTLVRSFPKPVVSGAKWKSYPANAMDETATYLHLAAMLTSPASRPRADNAVNRMVLRVMTEVHGGARRILQMLDAKPEQPRYTKAQVDAMATLTGRRIDRDGTDVPRVNAIEALLETRAEDERRLTDWLDDYVARGDRPTGMLGTMVDLHAARRYYQRPEAQVEYEPRPIEGATTPPVENPEPDFHQLAAGAGSTPALLRALGLAVDLTVVAEHLPALATATWVSVTFVPGAQDEGAFEKVEPPRTQVHVVEGSWQAVASAEWSGGRLKLGDPDRYQVLSLDPDATGLATEQNLRNAIGEIASELNGDKANGAPTSLRSTGFSLARLDRVDASRDRVQTAEGLSAASTPLSLTYDQIVRGVRLQVREGAQGPWRSVHRRLVDVLTPDRTTVLEGVPDAGFLPLTSLSRSGTADPDPYYLHEVFAGWDGWSLSAPRPGKVVVHGEDGEEQLLDEPPVPADGEPLARIRSRVEPGTLPRLRYGTSYSFRVQGVDLAGNEVQEGEPDPVPISTLRAALTTHRATSLGDPLRRTLAASVPKRTRVRPTSPFDDATAKAAPAFRPRLAEAAREIAGDSLVMPASQITKAERRLADLVSKDARQRRGVSDLDRLRDAVERTIPMLSDLHVRPDLFPDVLPPTQTYAPTDTLPVPFLRWSPVPAPVLVPRRELTLGESLGRLVIREGETSERHVAPAKTSQLEAEQHGMFDAAIGSSDPDVQRTVFGWALRERGTLLDEWVPDLDNPGEVIQQPGIALASRPGANPEAAVTLQQITDTRDTPLGEGQYVVHDVDQLVLPYLPDPLAAGMALVFVDAGAPHTLPEPRVLSAVVVPFRGEWPRVEPLQLVLEPGTELGASVDEAANLVRVTLPAGEQVRVAISSSLREEDLQVLGLWRSTAALLEAVEAHELLALLRRAAVSGWTWWLTPSEEMRLVHATPRPARRPALHDLAVLARPEGATVAALFAITEMHGASTATMALAATWSEWVDDVTTPGPVQVERSDVPVRSQVGEGERYGLLYPWDDANPATGVPMHRAIQNFPDTHHRRVTYTLIGSTRYAEFFAPDELAGEDDPESRSDPVGLTVQSSARPAAPVVTETVPLLLWDVATEPEHPFARRHVRRSGARIWMNRPWYSSGDGELLALVLGEDLPPTVASRWGSDPGLSTTAPVPDAALPPLLTATDLLFAVSDLVAEPGTDADLPRRPGGPVLSGRPRPLVDVTRQPQAALLGYEAEFHPDRNQWFVDVAMTPRDQLWPFVRLAVARFQPDSLAGCELSPVVMTDWVQPLPERTATVSRPDATHVHVTVTGAAALYRTLDRDEPDEGYEWDRGDPTVDRSISPLDKLLLGSRVLVATVQQRGESDLEWLDHATVRLPAVGQDPSDVWQVTWSQRLELPVPIPLVTPDLGTGEYRVLIEELEVMAADHDPDPATRQRLRTRLTTRVVYADTFTL